MYDTDRKEDLTERKDGGTGCRVCAAGFRLWRPAAAGGFCQMERIFSEILFLFYKTWKGKRGDKKVEKDELKKDEAETRIAVIGIIIEDKRQVEKVNGLLHQYGRHIIGRMGLPYEKRQVNIISVVLDAPDDMISALSGKLGRLPGVSSKALYAKK